MKNERTETVTLGIRMTKSLRALIEARATEHGVTASEYVRRAALEALIANK